MINCTLINNDTGEIMNEDFRIDEMKDLERKQRYKESKKIQDSFKAIQQENLGYFVFFIFKKIDELIKILPDADLIRFIYLGTYTKKDGYLKFDNGNIIAKSHVKKLLRLSDDTFRQFWKLIIDNKLVVENDKKLLMNLDYFYRGNENEYYQLTEKLLRDKYTRIYIETTRDMYSSTNQRNFKKLAIIYKLLPFINYQYNIICSNPREVEKSKIEPLTLLDISNYLGYDKSHLSRFRKDLHSLKYKDNDVFIRIGKNENINQDYLVVNPQFYYRGNDINELNYLLILFGLIKPTLNEE